MSDSIISVGSTKDNIVSFVSRYIRGERSQ